MPSFTITVPDIHQGPGLLWYGVTVPASGSRMLVDSSGNPTAGAPVGLGGSEGAAKIEMKAKIEEIQIDQETAPVDAVMTAEDAIITVSLKESSLAKISKFLGHATYSSGNDAGLPASAQAYEELTSGGLIALPQAAVALISPRRGFSSPGKYMVFVLYNAYGVAALDLSFTRTKESVYKCEFHGLAVTTRTAGDRVCQFYRQT